MTSERKDMDNQDATVSRAYRQFSDETTSTDLDARILAEAARAARPGYVRPVRWMRPLAWAATIVLTVSIIVHMAELPTPADIAPPVSDPDVTVDDAADARFDVLDDDVLDDDLPDDNVPNENIAAPAQTSGPAAAKSVPQALETPAPAGERREFAVAGSDSTDATAMKTAESIEEATRSLADADLLRRASDLARQQESGSEAAPAAEMAFTTTATRQPASACTDEERRSADSWFACIERLRAAGQNEAAAAELAQLGEDFPDFEVP